MQTPNRTVSSGSVSPGALATATSRWEKRNIALEIPVWDPAICIQCNKCALVCPHAAIRAKVYEPRHLEGAPATFKAMEYKAADFKGMKYTIQVAPEDCTGCRLCAVVCPAKDKSRESFQDANRGYTAATNMDFRHWQFVAIGAVRAP